MFSASESNEISKVTERFGTELEGKCFAIWGAGPRSRQTIDWLVARQGKVNIHSREGLQVSDHEFERGTGVSHPSISRMNCHLHALQGAHALILFDDLDFYRGVDPGALRWYARNLEIIDLYDCLNLDWFKFSRFPIFRSDSCQQNVECDTSERIALAGVGA